MKPRWLFYKDGHDLDLDEERTIKEGKEIFLYTAKAQATAFIDKLGRILTPNKKNWSDLCSIPAILSWFKGFERWRYRMTGVLHDNCYGKGGLWQYMGSVEEYIIKSDPAKFKFVKFSRDEADKLLEEMIPAEAEAQNYTGFKRIFWEKYSKFTSHAYFYAVRFAGWLSWRGSNAK